MYSVLLVEDNYGIASLVEEFLHTKTCDVFRAESLQAAHEQFSRHDIDIVLLDVMLPDGLGFSFLRDLKKSHTIPVIMLTAKGELEDKEQWFLSGADDYLVKPFELKELWRRMESVLKQHTSSDVIHIGELFIDLKNNRIVKNMEEIHVSHTERLLFSFLVMHQGQVVQRTALVSHIWGDDDVYVHSRALDVHVSRLRNKIGKQYIETVNNVGYKLMHHKGVSS